ncbi:uncharacterized protein V1516DRAFT_607156, partial [Lipomyces oligophaga]|uniref:uncharacterized protein n=1 Tax=Lipomyces oligophaga TaxID=45792 RepID=UPI0034CE6207
MTRSWTREEWQAQRRLVRFVHYQRGAVVRASAYAISQQEYTQRIEGEHIVSCMYWAERKDFYVTSVDCIQLLEHLVCAQFTVEEKNRIRRNLEGYRPLTVSKSRADSNEFFKVIMGFTNPKPRNIEKDVKVFPWRVLGLALKKIVGKYSAS